LRLVAFIKAPYIIINDTIKFIVSYMPGSFGGILRYHYYKNKLKRCGKHVIIDVGVMLDGLEHISIGENVHIDKYCIISTGKHLLGKITCKKNEAFNYDQGELVIGNNVHIVHFSIIMAYGGVLVSDNCTLSAGSKIYSLTNTYYDPEDRGSVISIMPYEQAPFLLSPVVLKKNVWLGLNSIIMPGTLIGENSFVVSNSLLMGSFPENSYISGQPAKRIGDRFATRVPK
jgi:acetyltransferase-like isoleucine patch superfamily enzyme